MATNPVLACAPMNRHSSLHLIGLAGRAGAGKDTCADIMFSQHDFATTAFAAPLRREIISAFRIDGALFSVEQKERRAPALAINRCADSGFIQRMTELGVDLAEARSPREIMRWWGTEYRRHQNEQYWTDLMRHWIDCMALDGIRRIVITDVRFLNEAQFIQSLGGSIWRIRRPAAEAKHVDHQSETEVAAIWPDAVIDNTGSLGDLAREIEATLLETFSTRGEA